MGEINKPGEIPAWIVASVFNIDVRSEGGVLIHRNAAPCPSRGRGYIQDAAAGAIVAGYVLVRCTIRAGEDNRQRIGCQLVPVQIKLAVLDDQNGAAGSCRADRRILEELWIVVARVSCRSPHKM